jgi:Uma2 family endonuclease
MTPPAASPPVTELDDAFYPVHEEDDVPESPEHEQQNTYLRPALRAHLRGAFVTGNICICWEPGNTKDYAAPDVLVVPGWQPETRIRVYRLWAFPPIAFVAEIFSVSDTTAIRKRKERRYAEQVGAREYLSYDEERGTLVLRRLGARGYEAVEPLPNGRVRSEQLGLEFGCDETGFLWAYTLEGEKLPNYEELEELAAEEGERRQVAEARAAEEAREREAERQRRREAEARAAELERELAALRARLQDNDAS